MDVEGVIERVRARWHEAEYQVIKLEVALEAALKEIEDLKEELHGESSDVSGEDG